MAGKRLKEIPLSTIIAAMHGDENALNEILNHYKGYIRCLSTRVLKDDDGNEYIYVDEDKRTRLEVKLICSIMKDYKILPA